MPSRSELKELASLRLQEAETLYNAGHYDGAVYLAGYAVEFALKARICRVLGTDYPDHGRLKQAYAVHDLEILLLLSGLKPKLDPRNAALFDNWLIAIPWNPQQRYDAKGTYSQQDAMDVLDAIRDKTHGVFRWIKKYW